MKGLRFLEDDYEIIARLGGAAFFISIVTLILVIALWKGGSDVTNDLSTRVALLEDSNGR